MLTKIVSFQNPFPGIPGDYWTIYDETMLSGDLIGNIIPRYT